MADLTRSLTLQIKAVNNARQTINALRAQIDALHKDIKEINKFRPQSGLVDKYGRAMGSAADQTRKAVSATTAMQQAQDKAAGSTRRAAEATSKQKAKLSELNAQVGNYKKQIGELSAMNERNVLTIQKQQAQLSKLGAQMSAAAAKAKAMGAATQKASQYSVAGFKSMIAAQAMFLAGFAVILAPIQAFTAALKAAVDIQNEFARTARVVRSDVQSQADALESAYGAMTTEMVRTGKSAQEVSEVLYQMGSAGLSAEASVASLNSTMNVLIGTEADLTTVTKTIAGIYNNLKDTMYVAANGAIVFASASDAQAQGLARATDQAEQFATINDVLVRTFREHQVEMAELNDGLKYSIATASAVGITFTELTSALATLNDHMIKGGIAGRSLQSMLSRIAKTPKKFAEAFGVAFDPSQPLDFLDVMKQVNANLGSGTLTVEQIGVAFERMGLRGAKTFITLAQNYDELAGNIKDLEMNSKGAAAEMAKIMLDRPAAILEKFWQMIVQISNATFGPLIAAFFGLLKVINSVYYAMVKFSDALGGMPGLIAKIVAAFAGFYVVIAILLKLNAVTLKLTFNLEMMMKIMAFLLHPVTLVVAGIAALVAVAAGIRMMTKWAENHTESLLKMYKASKKAGSGMEELSDARKSAALSAQMIVVQGLGEEMDSYATSIKDMATGGTGGFEAMGKSLGQMKQEWEALDVQMKDEIITLGMLNTEVGRTGDRFNKSRGIIDKYSSSIDSQRESLEGVSKDFAVAGQSGYKFTDLMKQAASELIESWSVAADWVAVFVKKLASEFVESWAEINKVLGKFQMFMAELFGGEEAVAAIRVEMEEAEAEKAVQMTKALIREVNDIVALNPLLLGISVDESEMQSLTQTIMQLRKDMGQTEAGSTEEIRAQEVIYAKLNESLMMRNLMLGKGLGMTGDMVGTLREQFEESQKQLFNLESSEDMYKDIDTILKDIKEKGESYLASLKEWAAQGRIIRDLFNDISGTTAEVKLTGDFLTALSTDVESAKKLFEDLSDTMASEMAEGTSQSIERLTAIGEALGKDISLNEFTALWTEFKETAGGSLEDVREKIYSLEDAIKKSKKAVEDLTLEIAAMGGDTAKGVSDVMDVFGVGTKGAASLAKEIAKAKSEIEKLTKKEQDLGDKAKEQQTKTTEAVHALIEKQTVLSHNQEDINRLQVEGGKKATEILDKQTAVSSELANKQVELNRLSERYNEINSKTKGLLGEQVEGYKAAAESAAALAGEQQQAAQQADISGTTRLQALEREREMRDQQLDFMKKAAASEVEVLKQQLRDQEISREEYERRTLEMGFKAGEAYREVQKRNLQNLKDQQEAQKAAGAEAEASLAKQIAAYDRLSTAMEGFIKFTEGVKFDEMFKGLGKGLQDVAKAGETIKESVAGVGTAVAAEMEPANQAITYTVEVLRTAEGLLATNIPQASILASGVIVESIGGAFEQVGGIMNTSFGELLTNSRDAAAEAGQVGNEIKTSMKGGAQEVRTTATAMDQLRMKVVQVKEDVGAVGGVDIGMTESAEEASEAAQKIGEAFDQVERSVTEATENSAKEVQKLSQEVTGTVINLGQIENVATPAMTEVARSAGIAKEETAKLAEQARETQRRISEIEPIPEDAVKVTPQVDTTMIAASIETIQMNLDELQTSALTAFSALGTEAASIELVAFSDSLFEVRLALDSVGEGAELNFIAFKDEVDEAIEKVETLIDTLNKLDGKTVTVQIIQKVTSSGGFQYGGYVGDGSIARVTAGEGYVPPGAVKHSLPTLRALNAGAGVPYTGPVATFTGPSGIDNVQTALPSGSFVLNPRAMRTLEGMGSQTERTHYQMGGLVEGADTPAGGGDPEGAPARFDLTLNVGGEEQTYPLYGRENVIRDLQDTLEKEDLTRL